TATSTLAPTPAPTPTPATSVTLSGRITQTPPTTWTEVAGAVFTISEGVNAGKSVVADSFGYYQLAGLTPGSMTVSVTAHEHVAASRNLVGNPDSAADFDWMLSPN